MYKDIKMIFMGTPSFAVPILEALIDNYNVIMVVCQPDKEKDRKGNIIYSPCKEIALKNNIEVYQPNKIRLEYQYILDKNPDIIITAAYGQIIPLEILEYPRYGCINVHGSLLPKLRGGAPIHHAIINGDKIAGVTIMYMDKKMDAGDIISQRSIEIGENTILDDLYYKLSIIGRDLLLDTLPNIFNGTNDRIKQDEDKVTFGFNITKEEEKIDFNDTSNNIHNKIRGLSSIPGAYAIINNKRMKIYLSEKTNNISKSKPGTINDINENGIIVSTKDYDIILKDIKLEGKNRCNVKDFINGIRREDYIGGVFNE
ncbi:MAG: methionyl-tRNA formyltransferase [Bacilli bacterium]